MTSIWDARSLRLIAAGIVVINGFFPAVWILLTSLKTETELVSKPITYFPRNLTLQNYVQAFTDQPLLKYLGNSMAVALSATLFSLLVSALAAYAIARLNLKNRQLILTCIVASSMFPLVTLLVPIFETMRSFGLLNSYTGVHAGAGGLLPEHPERPGERRDDRRLHARGRTVARGRAAGGAGRVHRWHPGLRQLMGRIPAGAVAQQQPELPHAAGGHHAVPG